MSSLHELIKKIQIGKASSDSYVYYDKETGKIHKISSTNNVEEGFEVVAISTDEVKPILTGERRSDEFIITYDVSLKQLRLKEIAYDNDHNTAATMSYQLPVIKNLLSGHASLEEIYEGVDIFMYDPTYDYEIGTCVWYENNVYKLKKFLTEGVEFNPSEHNLFVEDVILCSLPNQSRIKEKVVVQPEYVGVHVDVWYKELSHLAGQHVWINGAVYRLLNDQDSDTEFNIKNSEKIISNVKLYNDENKMLETNKALVKGDIILDNNKLYSVDFEEQEMDENDISTFFYLNSTITTTVDDLIPVTDLKNGQKLLSGKRLYHLIFNKDYDIIVRQNTQDKVWDMVINPYTKKFLRNTNEKLYFSITSKYDPNILYRSLEFNVGELIEKSAVIPFIYDIESSAENVSIYTAKYFDSYAHEVINDKI